MKTIIDSKELEDKLPKDKLPKEYLSETLDKWKNLKEDKKKRIKSMRYPIISTVGVILFALSIITSNSFELVNDNLKALLISIVIFFFIVFAFLNLIFLSIYILRNLPHE